MTERKRPDSPFPHQWNLPLGKKEGCPSINENHVYVNSSNGYLDKGQVDFR